MKDINQKKIQRYEQYSRTRIPNTSLLFLFYFNYSLARRYDLLIWNIIRSCPIENPQRFLQTSFNQLNSSKIASVSSTNVQQHHNDYSTCFRLGTVVPSTNIQGYHICTSSNHQSTYAAAIYGTNYYYVVSPFRVPSSLCIISINRQPR